MLPTHPLENIVIKIEIEERIEQCVNVKLISILKRSISIKLNNLYT